MEPTTLTDILNKIPMDTVIQSVIAAGGLSFVLQKLKNYLSLQSSRVINFINLLLSSLVVLIQGLISATTQNPSLIPSKALGLMSLTILVYSAPGIGIKSLSTLVADVKETRARKALNASSVPIQEQNLIQPEAEALTDSVTPVTPADF